MALIVNGIKNFASGDILPELSLAGQITNIYEAINYCQCFEGNISKWLRYICLWVIVYRFIYSPNLCRLLRELYIFTKYIE